MADMVLLDDLERCKVRLVKGQTVAREGMLVSEHMPVAFPAEMFHSLRLKPAVSSESFKISTPLACPRVRVMELLSQTITAEKILELKSAGGAIAADPGQDLLKIAMFDRHHDSGAVALGLLKGFGAKLGANRSHGESR